MGLAYFFDFSDEEKGEEKADLDPRSLTWVYETPTSILKLPVPYELKDIPLP